MSACIGIQVAHLRLRGAKVTIPAGRRAGQYRRGVLVHVYPLPLPLANRVVRMCSIGQVNVADGGPGCDMVSGTTPLAFDSKSPFLSSIIILC